jgi:hypothetical protein
LNGDRIHRENLVTNVATSSWIWSISRSGSHTELSEVKVKVKVKLSLCLFKHYGMKTYGRVEV